MVDDSLDCHKNIELHFFSTQNIVVQNSVTLSKNRCGNCGATPESKDLDFFFDINTAEFQMTPIQVAAKARADVRYASAAPQCNDCFVLKIERVAFYMGTDEMWKTQKFFRKKTWRDKKSTSSGLLRLVNGPQLVGQSCL